MSLILSGTDGLSDVDGSAATPAIRGTDANTGIFFGADIIGFAEGGAEVARFNADAQFVAAAGTASLPVITTTGDVNTGIFFPAADTIAFAEGGVESMRIDSSSNVGIGTNSPGAKLAVVSGTSPNIATLQVGFSGSANYYDANLHAFRNGSQTEVARIESGNLLVGTTSSTNTSGKGVKIRNDSLAGVVTCTADSSTDVSTYHYYNVNATNNGYRFYVNINGGISNYSANNTNLSDERTKTNIQNAGSYLAKICAIPVRTFKYKDQSDDLLNLGVIAQEVEAVAPELVDVSGFGDTPEDGVPLKSIYQTDLQYALMKCIQEQQALITTLTDRITALEAK
jgi:hypothetical protein